MLLAALGVDPLPEVAPVVERSHADEREPGVGRGLAQVAGEDAQPPE